MILTLTFNPAVDQTSWIDRLVPGTVHRVRETQLDPAGKGINVSRMAHRLGAPTVAFGLAAGDTGRLIERALEAERVPHHFVQIPGESRIDTTIVDAAGVASSFYGIGPPAPPDRLEALFEHVRLWLPVTRVLVLAGSLLPGIPLDAYARYVHAARERGVFVILDSHGGALRRGLEAGPDLIKPNLVEAQGLLGR
ncbi:MAG TPA: PfkB family carbohydrate kinase, partial [Myxococcales bacterium]|nr:PfkB family carbohydrate kinase [Myxococcales bacterium]